MTMFSKFTGASSSSSTQQQPAPLPPNSHAQDRELEQNETDQSFTFPSNDNGTSPPSPSPSRANSHMPPPPLPAKTTRIPRLSLVPASRDQWQAHQAHRNRLSAGGSSSSLKEMMEKNGSRTVTTEIRVECLERRVRNSKEDAVGLAKDILSLCEEAANVKQWYNSLSDKTDSIINELAEYRDENQQLRTNAASQKLRNEELSSTVSKLAKQLNNQANAFRELHAQVADQDRKLNDLLSSPRDDDSFRTSATSLSNSTITGPTPDLALILARLETLESAQAAPPARAAVPSTPAQVAEEKAKLRRAQEDHDREERRARQREVEAREREDKIQSLLGEALQRNITLAARVRELEATAKANSHSLSSSSTHSNHSSSSSSSNSSLLNSSVASVNVNSGAQTPSAQQQHQQKDRKAQLGGGAPAPSIPALDPFSPFVVDKGASSKMRGLVRGKGLGLRE